MPTLTWPTSLPRPSGLTFSLKPNSQSFQSPLTKSTQTMEMPGARWVAVMTWSELVQAEIRTLRAFLAQLRGRAGRVYLWDMSLENPAGVATGTPVVDGAGQTGAALNTTGWTSAALKAGNYFGVGSELKVLTADADVSADVAVWAQRALPYSTQWEGLAWNGAVFCVVASGGSRATATSPDGITWEVHYTLPTTGGCAPCWNGAVFCTVGYGSAIAATSPDGITWTQRALPVSANWRAIAWNGSVFCAVAYGSAIAATSSATGDATLTFEPPLRVSPANASAITLVKPTCTFRLLDDDQDNIPIQAPLRGSITLTFEEAFT